LFCVTYVILKRQKHQQQEDKKGWHFDHENNLYEILCNVGKINAFTLFLKLPS
jgi:hypothetical protein